MGDELQERITEFVMAEGPVLYILIDEKGKILKHNQFAQVLLGDELVSKKISEVLVNMHDQFDLDDVVDSKESVPLSVTTATKLPQTLNFRFIRTKKGILVLGRYDMEEQSKLQREIFRLNNEMMNLNRELQKDKVQLNKLNDELKEKNEKLVELDRMKDSFLSLASHEIRSPLAGIIGILDLLKDDFYNDEVEMKEYIATAYESSQGMLNILNDLLDLQKIETGHMSLNIGPCQAETALGYCEHLFRPRIEGAGLELIVDAVDSEVFVKADPFRLNQVITNLVGNALKFTDEGSITISADPDDNGEHVIFTIEDTGIGVSEEDKTELFKPFSQLYKKTKKKIKGTGLGLSICKSLVEQMGGEIWIESKGEGKGASVKFTLPRTTLTPAATAAEKQIPIS